jgi:hypothetical protein
MERTIITWNATNWLTVLLMVWLGGAAFAVLARIAHKAREGS